MSARPLPDLLLCLLLATSSTAHALPRTTYDLARPRACLAGGFTSEPGIPEWRLQFGVFADEDGATTQGKVLNTPGHPDSSLPGSLARQR